MGAVHAVAKEDPLWDFFMTIWQTRPRNCTETGKWLGNSPKRSMFHHLIHKSPYPEYAYEEWNIILLDPDIHELAHANIDLTPIVKRLTEEAWKRHLTRSI